MGKLLFRLEQRGCLHVILYLADKSEAVSLTDLVRNLEITQDPIYKTLPILTLLKLVQETHEKEFPRRRLFRLTQKGRKVAEKLRELEKILAE